MHKQWHIHVHTHTHTHTHAHAPMCVKRFWHPPYNVKNGASALKTTRASSTSSWIDLTTHFKRLRWAYKAALSFVNLMPIVRTSLYLGLKIGFLRSAYVLNNMALSCAHTQCQSCVPRYTSALKLEAWVEKVYMICGSERICYAPFSCMYLISIARCISLTIACSRCTRVYPLKYPHIDLT